MSEKRRRPAPPRAPWRASALLLRADLADPVILAQQPGQLLERWRLVVHEDAQTGAARAGAGAGIGAAVTRHTLPSARHGVSLRREAPDRPGAVGSASLGQKRARRARTWARGRSPWCRRRVRLHDQPEVVPVDLAEAGVDVAEPDALRVGLAVEHATDLLGVGADPVVLVPMISASEPLSVATMFTCPPPSLPAMPWRTAFSTMGWMAR